MTWVAETAAEYGTAAATTRNHFHFGSAGKYSRIAVAAGCVGIAVSSHRYDLPPESIIKGVNATSPISIAFPNGEQPPLVLDMGAHMLPWNEDLFAQNSLRLLQGTGHRRGKPGAGRRASRDLPAAIYPTRHHRGNPIKDPSSRPLTCARLCL